MSDKASQPSETSAEEQPEQSGFDYTKWQRDLFNDMSLEELTEMAVEYEKEHPHEGAGKRL